MKPMRMLIMLAVFWAAGSFLLAAESPPPAQPAPAAKRSDAGAASGAQAGQDEQSPDAQNQDAQNQDARNKDENSKDDRPRTLSEQAEAALKTAAEGASGGAQEAPKSADDAGAAPAGNPARGPSPQRFVPSEQVRADFDVSFPIDI